MAKSRSKRSAKQSPKRSAKKSPKRSVKRSRPCASEKQGYCLRCGKKVNMVGAKAVKAKNGRYMLKGKCPNCKGGVSRTMSNQ